MASTSSARSTPFSGLSRPITPMAGAAAPDVAAGRLRAIDRDTRCARPRPSTRASPGRSPGVPSGATRRRCDRPDAQPGARARSTRAPFGSPRSLRGGRRSTAGAATWPRGGRTRWPCSRESARSPRRAARQCCARATTVRGSPVNRSGYDRRLDSRGSRRLDERRGFGGPLEDGEADVDRRAGAGRRDGDELLGRAGEPVAVDHREHPAHGFGRVCTVGERLGGRLHRACTTGVFEPRGRRHAREPLIRGRGEP